MARLIDAEPLRAKLTWLNEYDYLHVLNDIKSLPTVDAESVKHGRWIEPHRTYDKRAYVQCTNCGETQYLGRFMKYCPNCGAKMDEVD